MTERKNAIWGEAAIFLSLDCADAILALLPDFNLPPIGIRSLIRESILENRKGRVSKIARVIQENGMRNSPASWYILEEFVEKKLAGSARIWRQEEVDALKFFDVINFNAKKCSKLSEALSVKNLREQVNGIFDDILARKIYYCVVDNERAIAKGNISDWDRHMMKLPLKYL